jgi:hypothetical protein
MNVLILTPDRVGSTLLQRLLTVYMLRREFGRPVINLHELTNGLIKYYNDLMNQEVLGKPNSSGWGYFQSLPDIIDMLSSVDHYKTSRLAHYHLINRNDSLDDQLKFYEYLNTNFYIISCRRDNLFEHGLSWAIQAHSKKLNVYSPQEKINDFQNIYNNGITVNREGFEKYLTNYVKYINWSDTYFNIQSYFDYDTHINNIEDYILNLDFMQGSSNNRWEDMFGQKFNHWNACHRLIPNLFLRNNIDIKNSKKLLINTCPISNKSWKQIRGTDWPETWNDFGKQELPVTIQQEIESKLSLQTVQVTNDEYNFFSNNLVSYTKVIGYTEKLKDDGFLVSGIPLKLQSLTEKKQIIKNFNECVAWYNKWVNKNNFGKHYSESELDLLAHNEELKLNSPIQQQLGYADSKLLSS